MIGYFILIMSLCTLKVVAQPAGRDPPLDLAVILSQAHLQVAYRVAVAHVRNCARHDHLSR
jgi:hypothetical protein